MAGFGGKLAVYADALGLFLLTRYPFVEMFMLLLKAGDAPARGQMPKTFMETLRRQEFLLIYGHAAIYFICGSCMTMDLKRRQAGFAAGVHLAFVTAFTIYGNKKMNEFTMARLVVRAIALFGGYLIVAGGLADSKPGQPKSGIFLQRGREMLAVYLLLNAYMLWQSPEDKMAYIRSLPGGILMLLLVGSVYAICGLAIFGGYEAGYFGRLASWLLLVVSVFVDGNTKYWLKTVSRLGFWEQIQIACRNMAVIGGLLLLARKRYW